MSKKKKSENEKNYYDYNKINKEIKQSYYDLNKLFINLVDSINQCTSQNCLMSLKNDDMKVFINKGADEFMVNYLYDSINNKINQLKVKDNINYGKLNAISKNKYYYE